MHPRIAVLLAFFRNWGFEPRLPPTQPSEFGGPDVEPDRKRRLDQLHRSFLQQAARAPLAFVPEKCNCGGREQAPVYHLSSCPVYQRYLEADLAHRATLRRGTVTDDPSPKRFSSASGVEAASVLDRPDVANYGRRATPRAPRDLKPRATVGPLEQNAPVYTHTFTPGAARCEEHRWVGYGQCPNCRYERQREQSYVEIGHASPAEDIKRELGLPSRHKFTNSGPNACAVCGAMPGEPHRDTTEPAPFGRRFTDSTLSRKRREGAASRWIIRDGATHRCPKCHRRWALKYGDEGECGWCGGTLELIVHTDAGNLLRQAQRAASVAPEVYDQLMKTSPAEVLAGFSGESACMHRPAHGGYPGTAEPSSAVDRAVLDSAHNEAKSRKDLLLILHMAKLSAGNSGKLHMVDDLQYAFDATAMLLSAANAVLKLEHVYPTDLEQLRVAVRNAEGKR